MSSSSTVNSLQYATQQINIYFGFVVIITGVIGGLLNIIVFTTLRVFRETSPGFYLTITSIVNIGQLLSGGSLRIIYGLKMEPSNNISFCKLPLFLTVFFNLMSSTSICLATVDQFFSITRPHLSTLNLAYRNIIIACIFWLLYCILFLIYYDISFAGCKFISINFAHYYSQFHLPVLSEGLPIIIMSIFALLAFFNVRKLVNRQIQIIRQSHDRQLTAMVLCQVICIVFLTLPTLMFYIYSLNTFPTDSYIIARNQLILAIVNFVYLEGFSWSFYIYCCVSTRFRKQLIYVMIDIHLNRWRQWMHRANNNQVVPQLTITSHNQHHGEIPRVTVQDIELH